MSVLCCSVPSSQHSYRYVKHAQLVFVKGIDENIMTKCYKVHKGPNAVPCKVYTEQIW